jgi:hypothetical protein
MMVRECTSYDRRGKALANLAAQSRIEGEMIECVASGKVGCSQIVVTTRDVNPKGWIPVHSPSECLSNINVTILMIVKLQGQTRSVRIS